MGLKSFLPKLTGNVEAPCEEAAPDEDCVPCATAVTIGEVVPRQQSTVVGEISSVSVVVKAGTPWLEVIVDDETGKLVATWTGRRQIAGVRPGQRLALTGRASRTGPGGRLLLLNPRYELL